MGSREQSAPVLPTQKFDVVVVGMGFAGLVAANRATEQGANVTIIDKEPSGWWIGGDAIISGQAVHICSISPMLPEDQLVKIINERTEGTAIPDLVNALVGNCKRAMKWLM
ncbi:FAD-binding protein, partial [Candidatus Bathyarchaeota archaeon]|nr:FAD-binding protein [Candidatus Bathyarchaeota archaeon]